MHELTSLDVAVCDHVYTNGHGALRLVFRAFGMDLERSSIRTLRLNGIDFAQYGYTFPELPGAQSLKHLQLVECFAYGPFMRMLAAMSLKLALLTIEESGYARGYFENDANDFVRSLSTLERVSLTLDANLDQPQGLLDWSTLHQSASVMKSLKVRYYWMQPPYPSDENVSEFRRFCKNALSLEQLSVSGIYVPMYKPPGDKYIHGSLEQFLVSLHLGSLTVVRMRHH